MPLKTSAYMSLKLTLALLVLFLLYLRATGVPIAKIASQIIAGAKLKQFSLSTHPPQHFAVKEVVLPFARFPQEDVLLGPEMRSTGEVMVGVLICMKLF